MAVVEELVAVLGYEVKGEDNLKKFKEGLDGAENSLSSRLPAAAALFGKVAGTAVLAVGAAAIAAAKNFQPLEEKILQLASTAGTSFAEMKANYLKLAKDATDAGIAIGDAFAIYGNLIAQGQTPTQAGQAFVDIANFAKITGANAKDAAELWGTLGPTFGFAASEAKKFFDIIAAGAAAGKVEPNQLVKGLPSAALLGKGFLGEGEEGLKRAVAITEAVAQGTGADRATVASGQLFKDLNDAATWNGRKKTPGLTQLTGIKREDIASGKVSLDQFAKALDEAGEPVKKLFTGKYGPMALQAFIDSWKNRNADGVKSPDEMLQATNTPGTIDKGLAERQGTMTQATTDLSNSLQRLATIIGVMSAPAVAEGMSNLAAVVNKTANAFESIYSVMPDFAKVKNAPDNLFKGANELGDAIGRPIREAIGSFVDRVINAIKPGEGETRPETPGKVNQMLKPTVPSYDPNKPENQQVIIEATPPPVYNVTVGGPQVTVNNSAQAAQAAGKAVEGKINGALSGANTSSPNPGRSQDGAATK